MIELMMSGVDPSLESYCAYAQNIIISTRIIFQIDVKLVVELAPSVIFK